MIDFDEDTHTYTTSAGVVVPSVTQILAPLSDFEHVPWDVLEAARDFGTHVHKAVEWLIGGTLNMETLDDRLKPYVKAADVWLAQANPNIIATEIRVYHDGMGYAGTVDLLCELISRQRSFLCYVDWKSSASLPRAVGPQTAAYEKADQHERGKHRAKRACVLLQPNGLPKDYPLNNPQDFTTFLSCKNIHQWKNQK